MWRSRPLSGSPRPVPSLGSGGFTLIELLTVVVVLALLATVGIARTSYTLDQARVARAIGDIRALASDVQGFQAASAGQALPASLAVVDRAGMADPWGNPYVYVNFKLGGTPRTDVFGVDLNSEYDIYSIGKDGASAISITAGPSQDDVVLGNDGGYIGRASRY
ncbi:MAG: prepilin-type N-terminal cleavage/methylation domain-containing protein [Gemmatimonadales bacterium]